MFSAIFLLIISFFGLVMESEGCEVKDVKVKLAILTHSSLHYVPKENVDRCKEIGIECPYNMPFLNLQDSLGNTIDGLNSGKSVPKNIKDLSMLPLQLFQNKQSNDELCMIESEGKKYRLLLAKEKEEDLETDLKKQIETFRLQPSWVAVNNNILSYLLEKKIIEKIHDGTIIQGPEGYFKEEIVQKKSRNGAKKIIVTTTAT